MSQIQTHANWDYFYCLELEKKLVTFLSLLSSLILLMKKNFKTIRTRKQSKAAPTDMYKRYIIVSFNHNI